MGGGGRGVNSTNRNKCPLPTLNSSICTSFILWSSAPAIVIEHAYLQNGLGFSRSPFNGQLNNLLAAGGKVADCFLGRKAIKHTKHVCIHAHDTLGWYLILQGYIIIPTSLLSNLSGIVMEWSK